MDRIYPDDYWITINPVLCVWETDKAFKVCLTDDESVWFWVPKSQMRSSEIEEVGEHGSIELPKWLVKEKENTLGISLTEEEYDVPLRDNTGGIGPIDDDESIPF